MKARCVPLLAFFAFSITGPAALRADPPKILEFRVQEVNQKLYFHLRLERPTDMQDDAPRRQRRWDPWWETTGAEPALRPRLVSQDDASRLVYSRERFIDRFDRRFDFKDDPKFRDEDKRPEPIEDPKKVDDKREFKGKKDFDEEKKGGDRDDTGLEFFGVFTGKKEAAFVLLYPKEDAEAPKDPKKKQSLIELLQRRNRWAEETVKLDPAKAKKVPTPAQGFRREENRPVDRNDLEGNWALAQSIHFNLLASLTPEFGFYSFANQTTNRVYKVGAPGVGGLDDRFGGHRHGEGTRQLYEVTTGAAAITESLALTRLRERGRVGQKEEARTVPISQVPGIDIAEHPWKKMMGDKKPAPEPLAQLIPHDNYYVHFKTITKFLDTGDLLDQWGTSLARAYEVNSRDYRIKQKLEQQLCLKSTGMARIFGPAVVKSMALTGNDPQLREGSDFSMIFEVTNKFLFKTGTDPYLAEARKKFGKDLQEDKSEYQGIAIETFVTPLREVSLHRASFSDYTVYSNSGVALRRIIDAHKNKIPRLGDSLDFQYMRTIFRLDEPNEDGFVFLSDAFIRNLVGPTVRIKERRRLEALTSMQMVTHGAMYTAWQTGKLALNHQHILETTGIQPLDLFTPDGTPITWNSERKIATSNVYNTLHFATPLIEIPIDKVTPSEAREYEMFRAQYMGLWRQFFDPIGIRLSIKPDQVKTEIYILPLVRTTQYNDLRRIAGDGTIKLDASVFSDKALLQYLMHLSPQVFDRDFVGGGRVDTILVDLALRSWLGDWFTVRFDDSPVYGKLMESYIRTQMFPEERHDFVDDLNLFLEMPVVIGFDVRSPMMFAGLLTGVRKSIETTLPGAIEWGPMKEPYKGVSIVRIRADGERLMRRGIVGRDEGRINPAFYYAMVDGAFYLSLQEAPIRDLIDCSVALRDRKDKKGTEKIEVNSSLHLGPRAAVQSKDLLKMYLEWEAHRRAQLNNRLLYALFRSNVVGPQDASAAVEAASLQYLGFVPVSPDLAPFRYEWQKEEVVNLRHGTLRQPTLNPGVDAASPLGQMLEQFATIRADLRFREDGIHTTLTMRRNPDKANVK